MLTMGDTQPPTGLPWFAQLGGGFLVAAILVVVGGVTFKWLNDARKITTDASASASESFNKQNESAWAAFTRSQAERETEATVHRQALDDLAARHREEVDRLGKVITGLEGDLARLRDELKGKR